MTAQTHKVATDALETLGMLIPENSGRDAIHLAVEPVVAGEHLYPGQRIKLLSGRAIAAPTAEAIGIVDPFLALPVFPDQRFWLVVLPRTITSLRHVWSHPAFPEEKQFHADSDGHYVTNKAASEAWMRAWAMKHVSDDYDGDGDDKRSEADAFAFAIQAGHDTNIGPYESARDFIDNEWWSHWETITGKPGKRGEYFSCAC